MQYNGAPAEWALPYTPKQLKCTRDTASINYFPKPTPCSEVGPDSKPGNGYKKNDCPALVEKHGCRMANPDRKALGLPDISYY